MQSSVTNEGADRADGARLPLQNPPTVLCQRADEWSLPERAALIEVIVVDLLEVTRAAELLVRCLQFGRRRFHLPLDNGDVTRTLDACTRLSRDLDSEFQRLLSETGIGPRHHNVVFNAVQKKVNVQLEDLFLPYRPKRPFPIAG